MKTFYELYDKIANASVKNCADKEIEDVKKLHDFDEHHLECLLNPDKHPTVFKLAECGCSDEQKEKCDGNCLFDAMSRDENGNLTISDKKCEGCSVCIDNCKSKNLADKKDIYPIFELLNKTDVPVYAMIAPAFIGQFSEDVTPGMLRTAFKNLGFAGMIEVALFADILTLKEALEFDKSIKDNDDFMLTSCCCPMWIAMIRKVYNLLVPHLPASVSPMAACGRGIKKLYPQAKTVFIGPCVAKKAEAREEDIKDSVDFVLTFKEVQDIFDIAGINPSELEEDLRDHSSKAGRIYARTGGVSEAVQTTLDRLRPKRNVPLRSKQANGVKECKELLNDIKNGVINANFIEGMGCVGGCVGGPKAVIDKEEGTRHVNNYGKEAAYVSPADNPYVIELLEQLGFNTIDSLLEGENMFTRNFTSDSNK